MTPIFLVLTALRAIRNLVPDAAYQTSLYGAICLYIVLYTVNLFHDYISGNLGNCLCRKPVQLRVLERNVNCPNAARLHYLYVDFAKTQSYYSGGIAT